MDNALVILCGGKSSRMGTDKALLPFGSCSLIEYLIRKFEPYFPKIYLSVQQRSDYTSLNLPVTMIPDLYSNSGPLAGVFSALSLIDEEKAFFISVDTPFVEPALGCLLLEASEDYDICAVERDNEQLETLSAVYSKNCTTQLGKSLLLRQFSLNRLHGKCNTHYLSEVDLNQLCPMPLSHQFYNMNTRHEYYAALTLLFEQEPAAFSRGDNDSLTDMAASPIPIISFVGDSIVNKKTFMNQLCTILKKDGIISAIFDYNKKTSPATLADDLSSITNVDIILTCDLADEECFKVEVLSKEINEALLYKETDLIAVVSDFNFKCSLPCFDSRKPRTMLRFLQDFIRDYGN